MPFPPLHVTYFPPVSLLFFPFSLVFALRSLITAFFATNNGGLGYYKTSREVVVRFLKGTLHYLLHILLFCALFLFYYFIHRTETLWSLWNNIPAFKYVGNNLAN